MECLKLTYKPIFELRTHERMPSREAKVVQMFISVDPLAERTMTPYQYVHNNPIMFTDPTGMAADPPDGEFGQGHRHTDSDGTKWQLNGSVWENQSGGGDQWQNETLDEITIDIDRKPSKLSADLTNAYSASGFRHGVEWTKRNVSFGIYDFFHNNPAVTGYGSGEYGAYIPDGIGVSVSGAFFGSSLSFSLVADKYNKVGLFSSYSGRAGYNSPNFKLIGIGVTLDFYDNYGTESLFQGIEGPTMDYSAGYLLMGGRSIPLDPYTQKSNIYGVYKTSGGAGTGMSAGRSNTVRLW